MPTRSGRDVLKSAGVDVAAIVRHSAPCCDPALRHQVVIDVIDGPSGHCGGA